MVVTSSEREEEAEEEEVETGRKEERQEARYPCIYVNIWCLHFLPVSSFCIRPVREWHWQPLTAQPAHAKRTFSVPPYLHSICPSLLYARVCDRVLSLLVLTCLLSFLIGSQ